MTELDLDALEALASAATEGPRDAGFRVMSGPKRIQMSRQHPWRANNPDAVIVARPSKWGNPFPIAEYGRDLALTLYRQALGGGWDPGLLDQTEADEYWDRVYTLTREFRQRVGTQHPAGHVRHELAGRDLACWCPLGAPCHADVLLELANAGGNDA